MFSTMRAAAPRNGLPGTSSTAGALAAGAPPLVVAGGGVAAGGVGAGGVGAGAIAAAGVGAEAIAGAAVLGAVVPGAAVPFAGAVAKNVSESSSRRSGSCSNWERISSSNQAFGPGCRSESPGAAELVICVVYG